MSRILITTLGKGQPPKDNRKAVHGNYQTAQYRFEDGAPSEPTQFFGLALYRHLVATGWTPDKIVVLGTSTSMWDAWLESAPELLEQADFADRLYDLQKPGNNGVGKDDLIQLSKILRNHYQVTFDCRLIPHGWDKNEQLKILSVLNDAIENQDEVILDVTHGFRHLPMLEMLSSFLLKHASEAKTVGIYYGALEMSRETGGIAPVIRLDALSILSQWVEAVAVLEQTGNVLPLARCPGLAQQIRDELPRYQFVREMNDIVLTVKKAKSIADKLRSLNETNTVLGLFRERLLQMFDWEKYGARHSEKQLHMAEEAFQNGSFFRSVILLFETVITAQLERTNAAEAELSSYTAREKAKDLFDWNLSSYDDREYWTELKGFRNALAHRTEPENEKIAKKFINLFGNELAFRKWFEEMFAWVKQVVLDRK